MSLTRRKPQNMKKLNLFFLLFLSFSIHAQVDFYFGRTYTDTLPEKFKLDAVDLRTHIRESIPEEWGNSKYERALMQFSDQSSIELAYDLSGGSIYSDWAAYEDYINEIVELLKPKELEDDPYLHIYLRKRASTNASMSLSGIGFMNIGLVDLMEDEATLAGILAHELAHYYLKHSVERFLKAQEGEFNSTIFARKKGAASRFSIENELESDSLAMIWLANAGYDVTGLRDAFAITEREHNNYLARRKNKWEIKETTHPSSEKRIEAIDEFIAENVTNKGARTLIDAERFKTFKRESQAENLKYLLHGFDYDLCIEKAFRYHLYDPKNSTYIYYIVEAIRRKGYLNFDSWKENFISHRYYEVVDNAKEEKSKVKMTKHLFEEFPNTIFCLTEEQEANIKARFYWGSQAKFVTNEEAFHYFTRIGGLLKNPEFILSRALVYAFDKEEMEKLLKEYLAFDNVQYREFAESLLNGTIYSKLEDYGKTTIMTNFFATVRQGKEEVFIREQSSNNGAQIKELFYEGMKNVPNRELVFLSDFKDYRLNDYLMLVELEYFSQITFTKRGDTELHFIDPRYWDFMNKVKMREIEFLTGYYYEVAKNVRTLESYVELMNTDYEKLFSESKRPRYLDFLVTTLRCIENGYMKIIYRSDEYKLAYKKTSQQEIKESLEEGYLYLDKKIKKLDAEFGQ